MLTVTQLARKFGISRTAVLYYEGEGLLLPAHRSANGYRWYGDKEVERLSAILSYRSYGVPVANLGDFIDCKDGKSQWQNLQNHFRQLENEISLLRKQQKAIVTLMQEPKLLQENRVTKERWVEIMEMAGFDDDDMDNWHRKFEEMEPDNHQQFLESLGICSDEIKQIRGL